MTDQTPHHVVIVGGGFGGLHAAKALGKTWLNRNNYKVTIIDKRNFHLFQPLLYQVATGSLSPGEIATPLRHIMRKYDNIEVMQSTVLDIDPDQRVIQHEFGELNYDSLIVATGVKHHYFGNDQWRGHAPGLKTVEHALEMRRRIFTAFEQAELEQDPVIRQQLMTFVVVGAGPTGVELAGSIAELAHKTLRDDFSHIDPADARIVLIEGAGQVLPPYAPSLGNAAENHLKNLGVETMKNSMVTNIESARVTVQVGDDVTEIPAGTILWAAGVCASKFGNQLAERTSAVQGPGGKLIVNDDMSLPEYPNIFVIGDLSHFAHGKKGVVPGVAPAAAQQGSYLAKLLKRREKNKTIKPFKYFDKGSMSVIGRNRAVAQIGKVKLKGFFAWWVWAAVHIFYLIEFDQKVLVMVRWAGKYFRRKRGIRLITGGKFNRAQALANLQGGQESEQADNTKNKVA